MGVDGGTLDGVEDDAGTSGERDAVVDGRREHGVLDGVEVAGDLEVDLLLSGVLGVEFLLGQLAGVPADAATLGRRDVAVDVEEVLDADVGRVDELTVGVEVFPRLDENGDAGVVGGAVVSHAFDVEGATVLGTVDPASRVVIVAAAGLVVFVDAGDIDGVGGLVVFGFGAHGCDMLGGC